MPNQLSLKGLLNQSKIKNHGTQLEENTKKSFNLCFSLLKNCWIAYKKNDLEHAEKSIDDLHHAVTRLLFHMKATIQVKKQFGDQL